MHVAPTDQVAHFDVDDTIILWDADHTQPQEGKISIKCPYDNTISHHFVHERHIKFLKKLKARGYTIVVWSAAGTNWAETVVKALKLESWVDWVQAKPIKVVDDLIDPKAIIGDPFFLNSEKHSL